MTPKKTTKINGLPHLLPQLSEPELRLVLHYAYQRATLHYTRILIGKDYSAHWIGTHA